MLFYSCSFSFLQLLVEETVLTFKVSLNFLFAFSLIMFKMFRCPLYILYIIVGSRSLIRFWFLFSCGLFLRRLRRRWSVYLSEHVIFGCVSFYILLNKSGIIYVLLFSNPFFFTKQYILAIFLYLFSYLYSHF